MAYKIPLESGEMYHIYNRGIDGCNLFYKEREHQFVELMHSLHEKYKSKSRKQN